MAADSRAFSGHSSPIGAKCKVSEVDGYLVGVSTEQPGGTEALLEWVSKAKPWRSHKIIVEKPTFLGDSFTVLVVTPEGEAYLAHDGLLFSGPLSADYFAIGSGSTYAMGALEAGATAFTAVRIAARLDPWTSGPYHLINHEGEHEVLPEASVGKRG